MEELLNNGSNKLILEEQKRLFMSSVESVDGFNEDFLRLTVRGKRVLIKGNGIKITQYNKANGNLTADGIFYQIIYQGEETPLLKKIFK